jgi:hypothetical protein
MEGTSSESGKGQVGRERKRMRREGYRTFALDKLFAE